MTKTIVLELTKDDWNRVADIAGENPLTMSGVAEALIMLGIEVYEDPESGLKGKLRGSNGA